MFAIYLLQGQLTFFTELLIIAVLQLISGWLMVPGAPTVTRPHPLAKHWGRHHSLALFITGFLFSLLNCISQKLKYKARA